MIRRLSAGFWRCLCKSSVQPGRAAHDLFLLLLFVKSGIRRIDQFGDAFCIAVPVLAGTGADADAVGRAGFQAVAEEGGLNGIAQAFFHFIIGCPEQDGELIAAIAGQDQRFRHHAVLQQRGRFNQCLVAVNMATAVIDLLEAVDIHHHQEDIAAVLAGQHLLQLVIQHTAVVQTGQAVCGDGIFLVVHKNPGHRERAERPQ